MDEDYPETFDMGSIAEVRRRSLAGALFDILNRPKSPFGSIRFEPGWQGADALVTLEQKDYGRANIILLPDCGVAEGFADHLLEDILPSANAMPAPSRILGDDFIPPQLQKFMKKSELEEKNATFCYVGSNAVQPWQKIEIAVADGYRAGDGLYLLYPYSYDVEGYIDWVNGAFDLTIDDESLLKIYNLEPLTLAMLRALGVADDRDIIEQAMISIGWPSPLK